MFRSRLMFVAAPALAFAVGPAFAQTLEVPAPSVKAKVEQRVGITDFSVDYSSPAVRGREDLGRPRAVRQALADRRQRVAPS